MSLDYIRKTYGVPAKRGGRIVYNGDANRPGQKGTIVGARNQYLRIRLDDHPGVVSSFHPTWEITYL